MTMSAASSRMTVAGWALTALCTAVLMVSAAAKLLAPPAVLEQASSLFGFPLEALPWLATLEIACALLYAWPRTSLVGAVLLTGYLGGAVSTHARLGDPAMLFPVGLGVCAWLGLYMREPLLRALVPLVRRPLRAASAAAITCALSLTCLDGQANAQSVPRVRTPDERFTGLKDYPFAPHYVEINGLRLHYVDEGQATKGTFLLLHGEPSWSYLYRNLIPVFVKAGYRTIAPDMIGFGRSDKVTDPQWYTLDAHAGMLRGLVERLDLRNVTIVVQDWAGPYGLVTVTDMPDRFARLVILNTWLHHRDYKVTQALRDWNARSQSVDFSNIGAGPWLQRSPDTAATLQAAYRAPFPPGMREAQTGALRWPWMLPFVNPNEGGADRQHQAYVALGSWRKPAHVMFGDQDQIFTVEWGKEFAAHIPGATFDILPGAGHMVQEVGVPLAELILRRMSD